MRKILSMSIIALCCVSSAFAQTSDDKPSTVLETMYILPKRGMDDKLEAAIKAHDEKFHPAGPYAASLRKVEYGDKAGWYVWVFGPTTYSAIDTRPAKDKGHADDWSKTVDPLVETYSVPSLWELNTDLSYGLDIMMKSKYREVWNVHLKRGQYYRFKAIAEMLKKSYESTGNTAFVIYNNPLHTSNNGDVAIVWGFNTYSDWSKDPGIKKAYEKLYGEGSWQHMLDEWLDITVDYNSEIRSMVN
jgi:hypothetical protein